MLDFSEAVGRMILDRSFRSKILTDELRAIVSETKSSIQFPATSYATVRKILNSYLTQHSYSLATDGEVIRMAARPKAAAHIETLAKIAEGQQVTASSRTTEIVAGPQSISAPFATAVGALTIDQELRGEFLASPGPIQEIPGLSSQDIASLQKLVGDSLYAREADGLCFEAWSDGCFARMRYYFQYNHPELKR
jgi:hypothetical protein